MSFRWPASLSAYGSESAQNVLAYINEFGRQLEASSHVRWHQEREHQRRADRPAGQTDHRGQRPLHPDRDVRAPLGRSREKPWQFISGQEPRCPMCELGWKSLGVLELTALPSIDEERWVPLVQETDVLLASGGDALYLCHWMRQSGLTDLLPSLDETVWVGLSAGSMVMTPRIGDDFVGWKPPTGGDETLGVVDFSIFPHVDNEDLPGNTMANAERWAGGLSVRRTRSTTRPPSKWPTGPSTSYPRATGNCSRPRTETCPGLPREPAPRPRRRRDPAAASARDAERLRKRSLDLTRSRGSAGPRTNTPTLL